MALRQPFSLINSEFNDFLFAPICDEGNGMTLSVLSALVRLDIDPWREAARLAALSRESAAQAFAPIIARIPGGRWTPAKISEIATRLVACLPRRNVDAPSGAAASSGATMPRRRANVLVIYLILSVAASFIIGLHRPSSPSDANPPTKISGTDARP